MEEQRRTPAEDTLDRLRTFILKRMREGVDRETITLKLVERGTRAEIADELVEQAFAESAQLAADVPPVTPGSLFPAIVGGGLAAGAGGLIWGLIAATTGYEIGWIAWAVGMLAGTGVVMFADGREGLPLQLAAVFAAALGILIGKYFAFYSALEGYAAAELGAEAAAEVSVLSPGVIQIFGASLGAMVSGFDALWLVLAVGTAWGIPRSVAGSRWNRRPIR